MDRLMITTAVVVLCAEVVFAADSIPYPAALDAAAVCEAKIADINREALAIGNGDLNGLLWESGGTLCLRVAKNDIWDARVETAGDPPMLKVNVASNTWTGGGYPGSYNKPYPTPRCAAVIRLRAMALDGGKTNNPVSAVVSARLDLRRAVGEVEEAGNARTAVRVLADRNVFLIESAREVTLEEIKSSVLPAAETGETGGVKWLHMKMPGDPDYQGMQYALAVAARGNHKAVAVVTSFDTRESVVETACRLAKKTIEADFATLVANHEAEWNKYWSASGVALDDPDFQNWWYRMVYMLRCFSRPGSTVAGLFPFLSKDAPPWHGDIHHNYNAWQPYWTPFVINHPDLAEPWIRYMKEMLPRLRWLAKTTYDCEGAFVGISSFVFEPDPAVCKSTNNRQIALTPWGCTMGMIGMSVQNLWYSYLYSPDRKYLKETIYPVLREAALFFCSFAEKCPRDAQGKAIFGPSYSPEHGEFGVANVPFDIAYARFSMNAAITAAGELGCDKDLVVRLGKAIELLPSYPTAPDAAGKDVVVDWTGCKFRQIAEHNIVVPVVPVFPADQVTWFSSEPEKELFRNTIAQTRHRGCNSTVMFSVIKARFSMPEALEDARRYYKPEVQPNGMFHWPSHGFYLSESVGIAAMISEYLVQSVGNIIRVFPCWPKEKDGSFTQLRAQGGFLVSGEQKSGKVTKLEIMSTVGGKLKLLSPWPAIKANGKLLKQDGRGVVEVDTKKGKLVAFSDAS